MARFAREEDFDFVKKSWEVCFDDTEQFVKWNFDKNYSHTNTIISECDAESASAMQLMPYTMMLGGKELSVRYVSGVATMPQFRGMGLVRELFEFGLPKMYDMGCDISILIPAVEGMYEKFGYRIVGERTFYMVDKLPCGRVITSYDGEIIPILDMAYQKDMEKRHAYIKRCKWDWERILTDLLTLSGGAIVVAEDNGAVVGYALAYPKDDGYEIAEVCGDITIDGEAKAQMPIMARVINAKNIREKFAHLFGNIKIKDDYISHNDCGGEDAMDIADFTKMVFEKIKEDSNMDMYINLLL